MREKLSSWARSPMAWIVLFAIVTRLLGIRWGLPHFDGWDDDGIAPRDFLPGVILTYSRGEYFTYPPGHLLLLTVLTSPIWIWGVAKAGSTDPRVLIATLTQTPYMTAMALTARLVSLAMTVGIVVLVGKIARELGGRRAGILASATVALHTSLTYYGHTTNLDGPYLFWACFSMLELVRMLARSEPRRLIRVALLACLAILSKDQAYALFVLVFPIAGAWGVLRLRWMRSAAAGKAFLLAIASSATLYLVVSGALVNPSGFQKRLAFLTGPASQDYAYYPRTTSGRLTLLLDAAKYFVWEYPIALGLFIALGFYVLMRRAPSPEQRLASLIPGLAALSFFSTFNLVALRTEQRFLMPQSVLLSVYAGIGLSALLELRGPIFGWGARLAALSLGVGGLYRVVSLDIALLADPRYRVEDYLSAHTREGETVEMWGNNVYLPRMPAQAKVVRLDGDPVDKRSYLPGVIEDPGRYEDVLLRGPRFLIVSDLWSLRFRFDVEQEMRDGRAISPLQKTREAQVERRRFFSDLYGNRTEYKRLLHSTCEANAFPPVEIHESTCQGISVFARP